MNASYQEQSKKINSLINNINIAMLTTFDSTNLRSRPMITHHQTNFEEGLYFLTKETTPKVFEIKHDPLVNVVYSNPGKDIYVSISGRAEVLKDTEKIKELWNHQYQDYFADGIDDPLLCLIKIVPEFAEYWDGPLTFSNSAWGMFKRLTSAGLKDHDKINFKDISPI